MSVHEFNTWKNREILVGSYAYAIQRSISYSFFVILNVNAISCAAVYSTVGLISTAITSQFWLYQIAAFVWHSTAHLRIKHFPVRSKRMQRCSQISWDSSCMSVCSGYVKNSVWVEKMCLTGKARSQSVFKLCVSVWQRETIRQQTIISYILVFITIDIICFSIKKGFLHHQPKMCEFYF